MDISKGGIVKKILYLFILGLSFVLPMNVLADNRVAKNTCSYKSDDLEAIVNVYDEKGTISAEVTLYKFGDTTWENGKDKTGLAWSKRIEVKNYSSLYTENGIKISGYRNYQKYSCPRYLLVVDSSTTDYSSFVEDDNRDLSEFSNKAFEKREKYIAQIHNNTNNDSDNNNELVENLGICVYNNSVIGQVDVSIKGNVLDFLISPKSQEYFGATGKDNIGVDKFKDYCPQAIYSYYDPTEKVHNFHAEQAKNNNRYEFKFSKTYNPEKPEYKQCFYVNDVDYNEIPDDGLWVDVTIKEDRIVYGVSSKKGETFMFSAVDNIGYDEFSSGCLNTMYYTVEGTATDRTYTFYKTKPNDRALRLKIESNYVPDNNGNSGGNNGNSSDDEYRDETANGTKIEFQAGCDVISNDLRAWLIQLLDIIKIGGLVLTLIFGMLDFFKGVTSGEADAMKKVFKSFSRRLIAVVVLFLIPLLIEFLLGLITINGIDASNPLCGIK